MDCLYCGAECKGKYCSNRCQALLKRDQKVAEWLAGEREGGDQGGLYGFAREYIIRTRGEECEKCSWSEKNPITGRVPIQAHHAVAYDDHRYESIELLCPNCHSLTEDYMALNKGKGRPRRNDALKAA